MSRPKSPMSAGVFVEVDKGEDIVPFLHLHFQKDAVTGEFARASRGVGIHHLGAKSLAEWNVQVPPLAEQHRIVSAIESYLTRLDDAVATLERVQRNLKRYRAAVLKAAVEGLLTAVRNRGIPAVSAHLRRPIFPGSWRGRRDQKETHVKEIHVETRHLKENGGQPR